MMQWQGSLVDPLNMVVRAGRQPGPPRGLITESVDNIAAHADELALRALQAQPIRLVSKYLLKSSMIVTLP